MLPPAPKLLAELIDELTLPAVSALPAALTVLAEPTPAAICRRSWPESVCSSSGNIGHTT